MLALSWCVWGRSTLHGPPSEDWGVQYCSWRCSFWEIPSPQGDSLENILQRELFSHEPHSVPELLPPEHSGMWGVLMFPVDPFLSLRRSLRWDSAHLSPSPRILWLLHPVPSPLPPSSCGSYPWESLGAGPVTLTCPMFLFSHPDAELWGDRDPVIAPDIPTAPCMWLVAQQMLADHDPLPTGLGQCSLHPHPTRPLISAKHVRASLWERGLSENSPIPVHLQGGRNHFCHNKSNNTNQSVGGCHNFQWTWVEWANHWSIWTGGEYSLSLLEFLLLCLSLFLWVSLSFSLISLSLPPSLLSFLPNSHADLIAVN